MSDAIIISLISAILTLILAVVTPLMIYWTNKKVDRYRKEVNGHMEALLQSREETGKREGRAELKAEQIDERTKRHL